MPNPGTSTAMPGRPPPADSRTCFQLADDARCPWTKTSGSPVPGVSRERQRTPPTMLSRSPGPGGGGDARINRRPLPRGLVPGGGEVLLQAVRVAVVVLVLRQVRRREELLL